VWQVFLWWCARIGVAGFFVVVRLAVHDSKIVKNSVFLQA